MAAQQRQHEASTASLRLQLETLQQQLAGVAAKLQTRDAQAKKYKDAVKLLKVGCGHRRVLHGVGWQVRIRLCAA